MPPQAVVLITGTPSSEVDKVNQRKVLSVMQAKKVRFTEVDGLVPENKELRGQLFETSGLRGKYPQVFIEVDGKYEFIGDYEAFEGLVECNDLPKDMIEANNIKTFDAVFAACMEK